MNSWPPPSTVSPQLLPQKIRSHWFRPAFWLGFGFNVLFCLPALLLLNFPQGSELSENTIFLVPRFFWFIAALLALIVGVPFGMWQMRKRQREQQSYWWEIIGLLLCFTPFPEGLSLLSLIVKVKAFASLS